MVVVVPGNVNATLRHDDDDLLFFPCPPFPVLPRFLPTTVTTTTSTSTPTRRRPRATPSTTTKVSWPGLVRTLLLVVVAGWPGGVAGYDTLPNGDGSYYQNSGTGYPNSLRRAVSDWRSLSRSTVVAKYGPIEDWDVSDVSTMAYVFFNFGSFNADLSKWQTGNVTTMAQSKCTLLGVFFSKQE